MKSGKPLLTNASLCLLPVLLAASPSFGMSLEPKKPNVLFITLDDMNDWIGPMGGHPQARTPNLDRLALRSTVFHNAHCQAPICGPSRASFLSGQRPSTTGIYFLEPALHKALPDRRDLLGAFRENGYKLLLAGKIYHHKESVRERREKFDATGPLGEYGPVPKEKRNGLAGNPLWDWGAYPENDADMPDVKIVNWAIDQLSEIDRNPFFLAVGLYRPHVPFMVPAKYFEAFPLEEVRLPAFTTAGHIGSYAKDLTYGKQAPRHGNILAAAEERKAIQAYLASIAFMDAQIGRLLDALDASPFADNTLVVITSDQGFHLGEKERWEKRSLWEESTRVPLMLAGPGISAGANCQRVVELLDLYPTLLDLAGLDADPTLEGRSIKPLLIDASTEWPHPAITTFGPGNHSVRNERWRYIRYADGSEELYDHESDSTESKNLASDPGFQEIKTKLAEYLPTQDAPLAPGSAGSDSPLFP